MRQTTCTKTLILENIENINIPAGTLLEETPISQHPQHTIHRYLRPDEPLMLHKGYPIHLKP